jgi:hypothetical protein
MRNVPPFGITTPSGTSCHSAEGTNGLCSKASLIISSFQGFLDSLVFPKDGKSRLLSPS